MKCEFALLFCYKHMGKYLLKENTFPRQSITLNVHLLTLCKVKLKFYKVLGNDFLTSTKTSMAHIWLLSFLQRFGLASFWSIQNYF